jgi:uncharacterized membrane protein
MTPARSDAHPAVAASVITLIAGLWLLISPWIYATYTHASAWNSWIVGVLIFFSALFRIRGPARTRLSWLNSILGIWILISPWVYGYTGSKGRFINSLFAGTIVFCAAIAGANSQRMSHDTKSTL